MSKRISILIRRYVLLAVGLFIMAFGVAFSIKAGLGTSPISSLPYVLSLLTPMTVGVASIAMHCAMILIQILLLRRKYDPIQLIQLPVAFAFGYMTDFAVWAVAAVPVGGYLSQWVLCIVGILLVGLGVACEVTANVVTLAGEGTVLAVCKVFSFPFHKVKIGFDVSLVVISCILALVFLHQLAGVREGTIAAAICVGLVARLCNKPMQALAQKIFAE
ncbi:MAG: YczE/YyaS/YitT family protein [Candidatus Spyradocola sp.]